MLFRSEKLDPNFQWLSILHSWKLEGDGHPAEAVKLLEASVARNDNPIARGELGHAYGMTGNRAEAAEIARDLEKRATKGYISPFDLSRAYEGAGQREKALMAMERAADERSPMVVFLREEPIFHEFLGEPRFHSLLHRLNLE